MAKAEDDERAVDDLVRDIKKRQRMHWIMDRFEAVGQRRRNVFSVDEAIEWWMKYKPRSMPTLSNNPDEEL
jgi:chromatin segregation and condensation protein Rec8/ScpA/Scc1 (kleisin family)